MPTCIIWRGYTQRTHTSWTNTRHTAQVFYDLGNDKLSELLLAHLGSVRVESFRHGLNVVLVKGLQGRQRYR